MVESIFSYLYTKKPTGELIPIKDKSIFQIEGFIRTRLSWCKQMQKNYKNKIFMSCGELNSWVDEINQNQRIGEAMKRDMAQSSEPPPLTPEEQKKKMLDEGCKYFDKNPGTNFTKEIYEVCVTR